MSFSSSEEVDYKYQTEIRNEQVTFGWVIINIDRFLNFGKILRSEKVVCTSKIITHEWHLILKIAENECISLWAMNTGEEVFGHMSSMNFSIINSEDQKVYTKKVCSLRNKMEICEEYGHPDFITRANLEGNSQIYMPNNTLKLFIEMEFCIYINQDQPYLKKPCESSSVSSFKNLFDNSLFSDVTISVSGYSLPAHKAILAAKSSIFCEIFSSDPKMDVYETSDWSILTMTKILEWIYTGSLSDDEDFINDDLMAAAHAYKLWDLKLVIEVNLSTTFSPQNALKLLVCAQKYDATVLKSRAMNYITKNMKTLVDHEDFPDLMTKYPNLVTEIFRNEKI